MSFLSFAEFTLPDVRKLNMTLASVFVILLFFTGKNFWKASKKQPFFIAGVASVTIFSVHSLVEDPLYSIHVLPLILIIIALSATLYQHEKNTNN